MRLPSVQPTGLVELLCLQTAGILCWSWFTWPKRSDLDIYFRISGHVFEGQLPYRDFSLEYPPLALVPILLPRFVTFGEPLSLADYHEIFLAFTLVLGVLTAFCIAGIACAAARACGGVACFRGVSSREPTPAAKACHPSQAPATQTPQRHPLVTVGIYSVLAMMMTPLLAWRYDAFPALLTALGLLAVVKGRPGLAGFWLGLGTVAKIYPMFLIGLWGAYYVAAGQRWNCARLVCVSALVIALVMLPFRLLTQDQWLSFLTYHRERGFEMGSSVAGVLWLGRILDIAPASVAFNYGAAHLESALASELLPWTTPALVLTLGTVLLLYLERFTEERQNTGHISFQTLASGTMAVLLAFIAVNKVFSPQYIIWLIPFVPFLPARAVALSFAITALTVYVYPFAWHELLGGGLGPTIALNLRNLLVPTLIFILWFSRPRAMVPA